MRTLKLIVDSQKAQLEFLKKRLSTLEDHFRKVRDVQAESSRISGIFHMSFRTAAFAQPFSVMLYLKIQQNLNNVQLYNMTTSVVAVQQITHVHNKYVHIADLLNKVTQPKHRFSVLTIRLTVQLNFVSLIFIFRLAKLIYNSFNSFFL